MANAYRICSYPECVNKHHSHGYCMGHGNHIRAGKQPAPLRKRVIRGTGDECSIRGCTDEGRARGLCHRHRQQAHAFRIEAERFSEWWNSIPGCMICGRDDGLSVDHDHSCCDGVKRTCGECNRGLLCKLCNSAIGMLGDDNGLARKAVLYLASFS